MEGFPGIRLTILAGVWYDTFRVQESGRRIPWRDVRAVDGTGLENRRCESIRGFESHSLRQTALYGFAEVPKWPKGLPC